MKKKLLTVCLFSLIISKISSQNFEWVRQVENSNGISFLRPLVTDSNGNIYSSGYFTGTVDLNTSSDVNSLTSNGSRDIFIQKLDSNGDFLWVKQIGGSGLDDGLSITVDSADNLYILGRFQETVDFDPNIGVSNLTSNGGDDIFIQKLDSNGNFLWVRQIGNSDSEFGSSISTDTNLDIYIVGNFNGTVDFDPDNGITNLTSNGSSDIYILKLDSNGSFIWVKQIGGTGSDFGVKATTDVNGNVYLVNRFEGTVDFDPGIAVNNITADGFTDFFVEKLDSNGNLIWVKTLTYSSGEVDANSIKIESNGAIVIGGHFVGTIDFDPDIGITNLSSNTNGDGDIFIQKLNQNGGFIWVKQIGGSADDFIQGMILDSNNDIYITGGFQNTVDFDPGTGISNLTPNGPSDIYIAKLNTSGDLVWVSQIGGASVDAANSITVDLNNELILVGAFSDTVDFNLSNQTNILTSIGTFDSFILKLDNQTLGIEDFTKNKIKIYPNPSSGKFFFTYNDKELKNVRIFNISGQEIYNLKNCCKVELDLNLQSGIYLMQVETNNKLETLKFIIE
ncbi:SBBP repeat-containing protein [Bacteroidota bacterium]